MRISKMFVLAGAAIFMAYPCQAQERSPTERIATPPKPIATEPQPAPPAACPAGGCACETPPRLDYRVLWQPEAHAVQTLEGRDIIVKTPVRSLRVVTKPEKRLVMVYVIKPKVVERTVPVTHMVDCVVKDPATGECHTVCQPVTEMKLVKDTEFYSTPEEKVIFVPVSKVEEFDDFVTRKVTVLGWRVDLVKHEVPIVLPPREVRTNQVFLLPQPPCVEPYPPPVIKKNNNVEKLPPPETAPKKPIP
jgi:hypothetical protein